MGRCLSHAGHAPNFYYHPSDSVFQTGWDQNGEGGVYVSMKANENHVQVETGLDQASIAPSGPIETQTGEVSIADKPARIEGVEQQLGRIPSIGEHQQKILDEFGGVK